MKGTPKNIFSYINGHAFTGREVKDWITYNLNNKTSKTSLANRMRKYLNIDDSEFYIIIKDTNSYTNCNRFELVKVKKK